MRIADIRVVIMCKAPMPGMVKTRLMSYYSGAEAARLHAAMATTVINRAAHLFEHVVIAADNPEHIFFSSFSLPVTGQGEGDLGERMHRQVQAAFADGVGAVLVLGTDSPHMPESRLIDAATALDRVDIVLGPVEDGGYDLIAMRHLWPVFDHIAWSSGQVLSQTLSHIEKLNLTVCQLTTDFDIDFPEDVKRAMRRGWHADCQ